MLDLQTNVLKKRISEQAAFANIFILEGEKGDFYQPILSVHGLSLPRWDILGTPLNWARLRFSATHVLRGLKKREQKPLKNYFKRWKIDNENILKL